MAMNTFRIVGLTRCFFKNQPYLQTTRMASLLVPPASVRGMKSLERDAFNVDVEVPCLTIRNEKISKFMPALKKYLLKIRNFKPVQSTSDGTIFYLNPKVVKTFEDVVETDKDLLKDYSDHFEKRKITFKYENCQLDDILKSVLPKGIDAPVSYSLVGHIVHLNLRDEQLPYKKLIGEVYLDKVQGIRTVVNKINRIDTTFRHFTMEILAGEEDTITTVKEHGYTYKFDFAKVYWNPRLSTEHMALVSFLKAADVLYDVFAGVGPFAIPAAQKGASVLANDLNPESYKWLCENAKINKIRGDFKAFNMDGREFLRTKVKDDILRRRKENAAGSEHIAMNLPALATEFLDVFCDWLNEQEINDVCVNPPTVHIYCFVKLGRDEDPHKQAKIQVEENLSCSLTSDSFINTHYVRNVAPNKEMMRVSFRLTKDILQGGEPAKKRLKIENDKSLSIDNDIAGKNGEKQEYTKDEKCIQGSICS